MKFRRNQQYLGAATKPQIDDVQTQGRQKISLDKLKQVG